MRRFSIRTLLLVTAVVAVSFAIPARRAVQQKRGREWVADQKGHVMFSHQFDSRSGVANDDESPRVPSWLVEMVGIDFFDTVDSVVLDNTFLDDLSPITDLRDLRQLAIIIEIDDNLDFSPLAQLPKLRSLYLDYTGISAERLAALRELLPHVRVEATNHPPLD